MASLMVRQAQTAGQRADATERKRTGRHDEMRRDRRDGPIKVDKTLDGRIKVDFDSPGRRCIDCYVIDKRLHYVTQRDHYEQTRDEF